MVARATGDLNVKDQEINKAHSTIRKIILTASLTNRQIHEIAEIVHSNIVK